MTLVSEASWSSVRTRTMLGLPDAASAAGASAGGSAGAAEAKSPARTGTAGARSGRSRPARRAVVRTRPARVVFLLIRALPTCHEGRRSAPARRRHLLETIDAGGRSFIQLGG